MRVMRSASRPASAALGYRQSSAAHLEVVADNLLERLATGGKHLVGKFVLQQTGQLLDPLFRLFLRGTPSLEMKLDLSGFGEDGGFNLGKLLVDLGRALIRSWIRQPWRSSTRRWPDALPAPPVSGGRSSGH